MKKINFQKFSMPDGIANKKQVTGDVRESFTSQREPWSTTKKKWK